MERRRLGTSELEITPVGVGTAPIGSRPGEWWVNWGTQDEGDAIRTIHAALALLPSLARTPEELIASNGATSTIESVGTLAGPLLAGALIALAPVGVVFAAAAAIAVTGAVFLTRVRPEGQILEVSGDDWAGTYRELRSGFEAMARLPGPRRVLGLMVAQTFVRGCLNVLIVVAAFRILHAGAGAVGYMTAAIGVGGLVGALGQTSRDSMDGGLIVDRTMRRRGKNNL